MTTHPIRNDWTKAEICKIYRKPLLDLIYEAATMHRKYQPANEVQVCSLLSIKTGGCPEDCSYCPQAARYHTDVEVHKLLDKQFVVGAARKAKKAGASRFCMGAAWREVRDNRDFDKVVDMVRTITDMGMEVCCTLGMIQPHQLKKLEAAGLYAYNHNVDTSERHYETIITTRDYNDRLRTLENIRETNITVCCGGIIGLGEEEADRIDMLHLLATMDKHPESVPINALVPVPGTPMEDRPRVTVWEMCRMIATARILMPRSIVRLSAGRKDMSYVEQAFCFMAGANSIFSGDKLLTTPNPEFKDDHELFELLGLKPREAFRQKEVPAVGEW